MPERVFFCMNPHQCAGRVDGHMVLSLFTGVRDIVVMLVLLGGAQV
jgi:hypothetical protein